MFTSQFVFCAHEPLRFFSVSQTKLPVRPIADLWKEPREKAWSHTAPSVCPAGEKRADPLRWVVPPATTLDHRRLTRPFFAECKPDAPVDVWPVEPQVMCTPCVDRVLVGERTQLKVAAHASPSSQTLAL